MQSRNRGWIVLVLFFGSGVTALIYEVLWSKFLAQMFGSTIYAQTVVLAVFMGGLALGNRIFGGWADGLRRPVRAYGLLELGIGIYAFSFPAVDRVADKIFIVIGTPIAEHAGWLLLLKGILSAVLLLGPTLLMGGTLPLLAAWLQTSYADAGRRSARFYSVNSLGAVTGAALAGFWLVQEFGMVATLQIAATTNLVIGSAAILLSRSGGLARADEVAGLSKLVESAENPGARDLLRWSGPIVALTGGVSMGLELLASRSLALIFGPSLQSFAIVLMAFILGIGLGSAWIASSKQAGKGGAGEKTAVFLLCFAGSWVTLLVFNLERWVDVYWIALNGLNRNEVGYVYELILSTGIALVILGIPAACIGSVLPLMIRAEEWSGKPLGARVGALLTWNTLGAVCGTLITGFGLMPRCGLRNAFGVLALILGLVAMGVAARGRWRLGFLPAAGACGFALCLLISTGRGWQNVMSSGIFRVAVTKYDPRLMPLRKEHIKIRFYQDAPDATVSVDEIDGVVAPASLGLRINGKPDASTDADLNTQFLLAHLPMLAKPDARDVFVLGLGSGMTSGALLSYPVNQVVIAENCEPVIRAAKLFGSWNRHVLDNPRVSVKKEDARTVLKLHPQQYDVIITEPSNPWTVGVGSVFSREFYELAASRLKPGGLICQWFHVYEMNDDLLKVVLRTLGSVFPNMEVWDLRNDIIILGSQQPWATGPEVFRKGFEMDRVRTDMAMFDIKSPEALLARQIISQNTGNAIAGPGGIQSDLFPILEYAAPEAFFMGSVTHLLDQFDERTRQQLLAPAQKNAVLGALRLSDTQHVFRDFSTSNGDLFGCLFGFQSSANVPCVFQTPRPQPPPGSGGTEVDRAELAMAARDLTGAQHILSLALKENPANLEAAYAARVLERARLMGLQSNP